MKEINLRWRHGRLPRCVGARCFVLFCALTLFLVIVPGAISELRNIRVTTPDYLFPTFLLPALEILDILIKGAHSFAHAVKRRETGR